jgi:hypothetical protein
VQRLFSSFADGWPGFGLLLLRLLTGVALIHFGVAGVREASELTTVILQIVGIGAGILLLTGLWTPAVGALAAIAKAWIALSRFLSHSGDPWIAIVQASCARFWRWSDPAPGPSMPGSSAGDALRRRNASAIYFSPKGASVGSHDPGNRLPDYIANA